MVVSELRLNRATLDRQMLLRREQVEPGQAVHRVLGLQAQEAAAPYLALWNRIAGFDPAVLDAALRGGSVVKASLLRLTLHLMHAQDWSAIHTAMLPSLRASRLNDRRFLQTGLTATAADELLAEVVSFAALPRASAEIEDFIADRLGEPTPRAWWALKMYGPFHHATTGGPWSFGRKSTFVAASGEQESLSHQESVRRLLRQYLAAYGPAEVRDFTQFTMLRQPVVRQALESLDGSLVAMTGLDGRTLYDLDGASLPGEGVPAPPRLLGMWDGILLAYANRVRVLPVEYRPAVIRRNGDVLPALLVDGYVAGIWRPAGGGVEVRAFRKLDRPTWALIAEEAAGLARFLTARDPAACTRFDHWWEKNSAFTAEDRVLTG
jgi:hypothetical protein